MSAYVILAEKIKEVSPGIDENALYLILDEFVIESRNNGFTGSTNDELLNAYLDAIKFEELSMKTQSEYKHNINHMLTAVGKPIVRVLTSDIISYMSKKNWKSTTKATHLYAYRSFFSWLEKMKVVLRSPVKDIKAPKKEKRIPKFMSEVEQEQVKEACKTTRERALVEVFLASGMRLSELGALNREDINFDTKRVVVFGKGRKERTTFLTEKAIYHLRKYLAERKDDHEALFVTVNGPARRMLLRSIQQVVKQLDSRAGTKRHLHPHVFRHTFATNQLNKGTSLVNIKDMLGHSDINTTAIYAAVTVNDLQHIFNKAS